MDSFLYKGHFDGSFLKAFIPEMGYSLVRQNLAEGVWRKDNFFCNAQKSREELIYQGHLLTIEGLQLGS